MSELKPCPFCGSKAGMNVIGNNLAFADYEAGCSNVLCGVHPAVVKRTEKRAGKAWNTRAK